MEEPSFYTSYNGPSQQSQYRPQPQPLLVYSSPGPQFQVQFQRQRSSFSLPPSTPTPTTPVPPWAALQSAPKKVSRLSSIGGGGFDFGTTYSTLPRSRFMRTSSNTYQPGSDWNGQGSRPSISDENSNTQLPEPLPLAVGPIPKVCRLRDLGGGGSDYGAAFGLATLPRLASRRRFSQPVQTSSFLRDGGRQAGTPNSWRNPGSHQNYGSVFSYKDEPASGPRFQPQRLDVSLEQERNVVTTKQENLQENQQAAREHSPVVPVRERRKLFQGISSNFTSSGKPTPTYNGSGFSVGNDHLNYHQEYQANKRSSPSSSNRLVKQYPSFDSHSSSSTTGHRTTTIAPNSNFIKFQPTNSFQEKVPHKFSSTLNIRGPPLWQIHSSQWQNDVSQWPQPARGPPSYSDAQFSKAPETQLRSEHNINFGSNQNVEPRANQFYLFGPEIAATDF